MRRDMLPPLTLYAVFFNKTSPELVGSFLSQEEAEVFVAKRANDGPHRIVPCDASAKDMAALYGVTLPVPHAVAFGIAQLACAEGNPCPCEGGAATAPGASCEGA